jgi:Protein of unknown function (DUF3318)
MPSRTNCSTATSEIQRLTALLPEELRSQTTILQSQEIDSDLVSTQRVGDRKYAIQIDFNRWQSFNPDQRNLLFWHEVAHIQGRSIRQSSQEMVVMGIGGIAFLTELIAQNLLGAVTTLAVTGLASYHLYQKHHGERALRACAAADRDAIQLAIQFGYSFAEAYDSLCSALKTLTRWKSVKSQWKQYQVRLKVLEILKGQETSHSSPAVEHLPSLLQYQVSSLCS